MELPDAYAVRPATVADAEVAHELMSAYDTRVIGHPDATLVDARDALASTEVEAVLVERGERTVGYATLRRENSQADIDLYCLDDALGPPLLEALEERARPAVLLRASTYSEDARKGEWLRQAGWRVGTGFARMRRDLQTPVPVPTPSDDVVIRRGRPEANDLRSAHMVHQEAFRDHYGFVPETYEVWLAKLNSRTTIDWSQFWLAEPAAGGTAVAMLLATDEFVEDDNAGYVDLLAVLRGWRSRGIARTMLLLAFRDMQREGRSAAFLHVDRRGTTGAYALYEGLGMRAVLEMDAWEKHVID